MSGDEEKQRLRLPKALHLRWTENITAPNLSYAAQYLAYALPYRRFACSLTTARA